ncbi:hypothetical protein [Desulfosporosinus acididurans]|uniref:hypothetical protein n=1 Tax=Desulfosporosinus acididurans TaxID=476652 RepID=UPI000AA4A1DE|nr:hypothetical protein [Desulfosporosinus acididurans]
MKKIAAIFIESILQFQRHEFGEFQEQQQINSVPFSEMGTELVFLLGKAARQ